MHPAAQLNGAVDELIYELTALSPLALAMAKRVLNHAFDGPLGAGLEIEGLACGPLRSTHDFNGGVHAFVEKRKPKCEGRELLVGVRKRRSQPTARMAGRA